VDSHTSAVLVHVCLWLGQTVYQAHYTCSTLGKHTGPSHDTGLGNDGDPPTQLLELHKTAVLPIKMKRLTVSSADVLESSGARQKQ